MGSLLINQGTDVRVLQSRLTGMEVVWDGTSKDEVIDPSWCARPSARGASSTASLLDQGRQTSGIVHGPDVVFPRTAEVFMERQVKLGEGRGRVEVCVSPRHRSHEHSGIYVKVIQGVRQACRSEELFITATSEDSIYPPAIEHAIIKYGDREVH